MFGRAVRRAERAVVGSMMRVVAGVLERRVRPADDDRAKDRSASVDLGKKRD